MKNTPRKSNRNNDSFQEYYIKRRQKSYELGKSAIDALLIEKGEITFRSIAFKSKEIDPDKKGITTNTIKNNEKLYEYYNKYRSHSKKVSKVKTTPKTINNTFDISFIKETRDINRVKNRYLHLTKSELVERILVLEQYIARNQKHWLENQFSNFLE